MKIWLITVGEPLPLHGARNRLLRTGFVAELLVRRGHEVLWWTSVVDHSRKTFFVAGEPRINSPMGAEIQFLSGCLYKRNVSLARWRNHAQLARRFRALASLERRPDVILCSFPTIELSREAVRYGREAGIPVMLDVRDLWPDIFLDLVPPLFRRMGRQILRGALHDTAIAFQGATGIYAVSDGYLNWGLGKAGRPACMHDKVFPLAYRTTTWSADDQSSLMEKLQSAWSVPETLLVTFAGSFGRTYDLTTVIAAAGRLRHSCNVPAHFVLCGAGEREEEWKALARDVPNVSFTGWLSAGELAFLLSRSAIGLAAYAAHAPQGLPNKVIEYMSAGLPVVCSLPGEARRLLEDNDCGSYYAANDPASLAQILSGLLLDAEKRSLMGNRSKKLFDKSFSHDAVYPAMAEHLEYIARI